MYKIDQRVLIQSFVQIKMHPAQRDYNCDLQAEREWPTTVF